jgi:hypothetical protein
MRLFASLLALCLLSAVASVAKDKAAGDAGHVPDAASLVGKGDPSEEEYKILRNAPQTTSGDWTYGLSVDDTAGLTRQARTKQSRVGKPLLLTSHWHRDLCERVRKPVQFYFNGDAHFVLKGEPSKGKYADAWISYEDTDAFGAAIKSRLDFSDDAGMLFFPLDPAVLAARRALSICPSATAPGSPNGHCTIISLVGFARAYEFVCEAK